jgi:hypothetical protein
VTLFAFGGELLQAPELKTDFHLERTVASTVRQAACARTHVATPDSVAIAAILVADLV